MQVPRSLQEVSDRIKTFKGKGLSSAIVAVIAGTFAKDIVFSAEAEANNPALASCIYPGQPVCWVGVLISTVALTYGINGTANVIKDTNTGVYYVQSGDKTITHNVGLTPPPGFQPAPPTQTNPGYEGEKHGPTNTGNYGGKGNMGNYQGGFQQASTIPNHTSFPIHFNPNSYIQISQKHTNALKSGDFEKFFFNKIKALGHGHILLQEMEEKNIVLIFFGSQVEGNSSPDSDVDMMIVSMDNKELSNSFLDTMEGLLLDALSSIEPLNSLAVSKTYLYNPEWSQFTYDPRSKDHFFEGKMRQSSLSEEERVIAFGPGAKKYRAQPVGIFGPRKK